MIATEQAIIRKIYRNDRVGGHPYGNRLASLFAYNCYRCHLFLPFNETAHTLVCQYVVIVAKMRASGPIAPNLSGGRYRFCYFHAGELADLCDHLVIAHCNDAKVLITGILCP